MFKKVKPLQFNLFLMCFSIAYLQAQEYERE